MSPAEVKRLGQFLSGDVEPDLAMEAPPTNYGDAPRQDTPGISWVLCSTRGVSAWYRGSWRHVPCNKVSYATDREAATYTADPTFYTTLYCVHCRARAPLAQFADIMVTPP